MNRKDFLDPSWRSIRGFIYFLVSCVACGFGPLGTHALEGACVVHDQLTGGFATRFPHGL